jgi:hypothetical protein
MSFVVVGTTFHLAGAKWQSGCVLSRAWIWDFSSMQSTTARSGASHRSRMSWGPRSRRTQCSESPSALPGRMEKPRSPKPFGLRDMKRCLSMLTMDATRPQFHCRWCSMPQAARYCVRLPTQRRRGRGPHDAHPASRTGRASP